MTMVTLYALLADDLRLICTSMETDSYFTIMTSVALVLFLMELSLASIGQQGYAGSFFFWLDAISTLSLITDIEPIWSWILGDDSGKADSETQQ